MKQVKITGKIIKRDGRIVETIVQASYVDSLFFTAERPRS